MFVLAAQLFAFIDGFDVRYSIDHSLPEFNRKIELTLYTDSFFWMSCVSH